MMTADRKAGQSIADVFPHLIFKSDLPDLVAIKDADFNQVDAVFCCLPHATTQVRARLLSSVFLLPLATPGIDFFSCR